MKENHLRQRGISTSANHRNLRMNLSMIRIKLQKDITKWKVWDKKRIVNCWKPTFKFSYMYTIFFKHYYYVVLTIWADGIKHKKKERVEKEHDQDLAECRGTCDQGECRFPNIGANWAIFRDSNIFFVFNCPHAVINL